MSYPVLEYSSINVATVGSGNDLTNLDRLSEESKLNFLKDSIYIQLLRDQYLRAKFEHLKNDWISETKFLSDLNRKFSHPAYVEIINMGTDVLHYLIEEIRITDTLWYDALRIITGDDPVPTEHRGRFDLIRQDWIDYFEQYN